MPLDYLVFDPTPCDFPRPRISPLPYGLAGLSARRARVATSRQGTFRRYTRARYALWDAYRLAGIGPGSALLAPAYHCRTMLDPAIALGGEVLLYPLHQDLSPDLAALDRLVAESQSPVKALLATHFFGIRQDLRALSAWCEARKVLLVEDCSHALYTENFRADGVGDHGAFVVASPYKFLPSPDGGLLYSRTADPSIPPPGRARLIEEFRGFARFLQTAIGNRRSAGTCRAETIGAELTALGAEPLVPGSDTLQQLPALSADYQPGEERSAPLRLSELITHHADYGRIAEARQRNYRQWASATSGLPHCQPLLPELPQGCVPYMFPLRIDYPTPHFHWLKSLGIPIWRWDNIAQSTCSTARDYRLNLLHLPCHQAITAPCLQWMITAVVETMHRSLRRPA